MACRGSAVRVCLAPSEFLLVIPIVAARNANKPSVFTPAKNISFNDPSAVAFRRTHGISDDVGLDA